jgi:hypothetical protein
MESEDSDEVRDEKEGLERKIRRPSLGSKVGGMVLGRMMA